MKKARGGSEEIIPLGQAFHVRQEGLILEIYKRKKN